MPSLFIILFLQGTDSFSLFKFDLLTFPLPCNLAIVWVALSMKDMRCQVITLYYSLRCQRPVGKLHLTRHYFLPGLCMLRALGNAATAKLDLWPCKNNSLSVLWRFCLLRQSCVHQKFGKNASQHCVSQSGHTSDACLLLNVLTWKYQAAQTSWKLFDGDTNKDHTLNYQNLLRTEAESGSHTYAHRHTDTHTCLYI